MVCSIYKFFFVRDLTLFAESGAVIPLLTEYQFSQLAAYAIYPQTRHLSQRVRAFVDFLVNRFEGLPYWDLCLQDGKHALRKL